MSATLLHTLFRYKAWANRETFAALVRLDIEKYPAERHTALRILNHIYVTDRIWVAQLTGKSHGYEATNTPETPTLEALRDAVFDSDQWYLDYISQLSDAQLSEAIAFTFTDGDKGRMTREEILAHVATHGGYHRGAAGRLMLQATVQPPRDSLSVYLHQSEPKRRNHP
jgi:uncharacterized damage-inducible protein DinB